MYCRSSLLFSGLVAAVGFLPAPVLADSCPTYYATTPKVSYEDSADSGATRIVRDYHGHRVFELTINEPVAGQVIGGDGGSYRLQVTLNGRTEIINGMDYCTSVSAASYGDACDWKNSGETLGSLSSSLFFYAAYEDHLNAWDIVVHAVKPDGTVSAASTKFHFAQKKFTELTWE